MSIKVTNNTKKFIQQNTDVFDGALNTMANDIKQIANITIPFKHGDLQKSGRTEKLGILKHRVIYDKKYAAVQEEGGRIDGTHKIKNYTTPGTGKDFLKKAGKKVTDNALNYLKQAANNIRL